MRNAEDHEIRNSAGVVGAPVTFRRARNCILPRPPLAMRRSRRRMIVLKVLDLVSDKGFFQEIIESRGALL